jgi:hypothetical protein
MEAAADHPCVILPLAIIAAGVVLPALVQIVVGRIHRMLDRIEEHLADRHPNDR